MKLDFDKYTDGLVPAIIQDAKTRAVLMLGYMNSEAIELTESTGKVAFFSRSRERLWVKGETSGNFLQLVSMTEDCDADTILVQATPEGPTCHTGTATCFGEPAGDTLRELEAVIAARREKPTENSYISNLFAKGINKIAQKVGEEAVEVVIAAKDDDIDDFKHEAADLLFHFLILLTAKGLTLANIEEELAMRRR